MPRSAVSMPRVAAIASAPKPTIATAVMPPNARHAARVTTPASQTFQPAVIRSAKSADEKPTIDPTERSTTPARSAKPEQAPTTSGTTRKAPTMLMLPNDRNFGPTE